MFWRSLQGIKNVLSRPISTEAYAGPVKTFRDPGSPGKVKAILLKAALAFANRFGTVDGVVGVPGTPDGSGLPTPVMLVLVGAITVPGVVRKKFVGKLNPSPGLKGNPECHLAAPVNSQPPIAALTARFTLLANFFPLPNGKPTTQ